MRPHADHGRRGTGRGRGARSSRALHRSLLAGGLTALAATLAATAAGAPFRPQTVTARDPGGDVTEPPDLRRVSLGRGDDGRLRAALTLSRAIAARDLAAGSGPPGSLCLRLWTASTPPNTRPDYLVCVTSEANRRALRGTVMRERSDAALPRRVAAASVTRKGERSLIVRFSQSSIGRPAVLRFAAEATRPGCVRMSCVDTAPDAPTTARIRLREVEARTGLSNPGS